MLSPCNNLTAKAVSKGLLLDAHRKGQRQRHPCFAASNSRNSSVTLSNTARETMSHAQVAEKLVVAMVCVRLANRDLPAA